MPISKDNDYLNHTKVGVSGIRGEVIFKLALVGLTNESLKLLTSLNEQLIWRSDHKQLVSTPCRPKP